MAYYFSTVGRVYQFCAGAVASVLVLIWENNAKYSNFLKNQSSKYLADILSGHFIIIKLVILMKSDVSSLYLGFIGSLMTFSLILILEVSAEDGLIKRYFFHSYYLCLIGRYSYGIYLVHLPVTKIGDLTSQICQSGPMRLGFGTIFCYDLF